MSVHIRLWLGDGADLFAVRNHVFEKAGCDFNDSPPRNGRQADGGTNFIIGNSHNLIQINVLPMFGGKGLNLRLGCRVSYTLNDNSKADVWLFESVAASVSAMLAFPGDAVLAIQQIAVLYRKEEETFVDPASTGPLARFVLNESLAQACVDKVVDHLSRASSPFQTKSFEGLDLGV